MKQSLAEHVQEEKQTDVPVKSYGGLTEEDFGMKQIEHLEKWLKEPFPDKVVVASLNGECDRDG